MPETANERLQDLQTTNQHLLENYKNEAIATALLFFRRMEKRVQKEITLIYDEDNLKIKDKNLLNKKVKEIYETDLNKLKGQLFKDAERALGVEASLYKEQLEKVFEDFSDYISVKNVSGKQLKKDFEKSKIDMDKGKSYSLSAFWLTFFNSVKLKLTQNIESAYSLEKTRKQFIDDTAIGMKVNEKQLDAVANTLIQQAYGVAILSLNIANQDLIRGYLWNSVLDGKTSPFCIEHSQEYWLYNKPELSTLPYQIYAPAHHRCRTTNPPITKSYSELGIPPQELTPEQKEYLSGAIPDRQTYFQWFANQPARIQKQILGARRYNAYKAGGIKIEQYFNNGNRLTIKELKNEGFKII